MGCFYRPCGISNKLLELQQDIVSFLVDSNNQIISLPIYGKIIDDYGSFELSKSENDFGYIDMLREKFGIKNSFNEVFDDIIFEFEINGHRDYVYLWHIHADIFQALIDKNSSTKLIGDDLSLGKKYNKDKEHLLCYFDLDLADLDKMGRVLWDAHPFAAIRAYRRTLIDEPDADTFFLENWTQTDSDLKHNLCSLWEAKNRKKIKNSELTVNLLFQWRLFISAIKQLNIQPKYIFGGTQCEYSNLAIALAQATLKVYESPS